ncbi:MAG: DUF4397 domain-containing protein [Chloroflexota bacterium]|nr:DUF4397 domain-containing protein [Chloroflexota bacterium]
MSRSVQLVTRLALALVLMAGLATGIRGASAQEMDANVRVIHASPDAPAVDIWVNGSVAIENLSFGEATDWVALPAGSYDVAVAPAGADAAEAVIEATLDLEGGINYNVAAVGLLADISATVFTTDAADLAADQARVQVIHASPDAPAVDVAVAGGPLLVADLSFPDASGALDVDAGTYDLEVRPAGTEDVALDLAGVEFAAGTVYDILAIGLLEDGSLTVLPLTTPAQTSAVGGGDPNVTTMPNSGVGTAIGGNSNLLLILAVFAFVAMAGALGLRVPATYRRR